MSQPVPINKESLRADTSVQRSTALYLKGLSQDELAAWQSRRDAGSAKWILAEKEWERRARVEDAKWQRYSALIGLLGVVVGAILSLAVGILLSAS